jgi:hypothetical protein
MVFCEMFCNIQMATMVWLLILNSSQWKFIGALDLRAMDPILSCTVHQDVHHTIRFQHSHSTCLNQFDSSIRRWFENFTATSINTRYTPRDGTCWRVKDGVPLCSGKREDSPRLVISIPVLLILEAPEDSDTNSSSKFKNLPPWDFPPTLTPSTITESEAKQRGITYDLIIASGLGLFSKVSAHFIARYADQESQIYTYDSMKNNGNAILEPDAVYKNLQYFATQAVTCHDSMSHWHWH